jgi:protease secretion system outer membrane protein
MRRSKKFFLKTLLAVLSVSSLASAEPLSITGLIELAMKNSPTLQKAEAERNEGAWKKVEGISNFLPTLALSANHFFDKKYQYLDIPFGGGPIVEFPQIFPSSSASLSAKWMIFDGLANVNLFRGSSSIKSSAEAQYDFARFQLAQDVILAYSKLLAAKKLEDVAVSNLKTLENHSTQVDHLKTGGLATHYDVLKVETQLSEAQAELLLAKDNTEIAKEKLSTIVGGELPEFKEEALPSPESKLTEQIKNLIPTANFEKRKDIQAIKNQVDAADHLDAAASLFWAPRISIGADYTKYNNLTDTLSNWNQYRTSWNVGIFINWNLFAPKDFSIAKQNKYKALSAENNLKNVMLQAPVDFAFWKKRYIYSATLYTARNADLMRATETVRLADAGFKAGVRTTTEVLDAELELFRARDGIVNAQINCIEAKVKLELALGEKL